MILAGTGHTFLLAGACLGRSPPRCRYSQSAPAAKVGLA
jgi:hypothetical protein